MATTLAAIPLSSLPSLLEAMEGPAHHIMRPKVLELETRQAIIIRALAVGDSTMAAAAAAAADIVLDPGHPILPARRTTVLSIARRVAPASLQRLTVEMTCLVLPAALHLGLSGERS